MTRVAVFVDYQNSYHCAREAFGDPRFDPPMTGHVNPLRLGRLLVDKGKTVDAERELTQVYVYRGQPGEPGHPKVISSSQRQLNKWRRDDLVTVKTRPLRYRRVDDNRGGTRRQGEEKGIDVLLALDVAVGGLQDSYEVGVVVSADTDLVPALEQALEAGVRIETATWGGRYGGNRPLNIPGRDIWNHRLGRGDFQSVRDDTDYLKT